MKKGFAFLGKTLLILLLSFLFSLSSFAFPNEWFENEEYLAFQGIFHSIIFLLAIWIAYTLFNRRDKLEIGLSRHKRWSELLIGMIIGIVLICLSFIVMYVLGIVKIVDVTFSSSIGISIMLYFVMFTFVAVSEEVLCRGYLQSLSKKYFGTTVSIILPSIIFTLLHAANPGFFNNPIPIMNLLLVGIFLAFLRKKTDRLWVPIGFHLTWNLFQGNILGFPVSGVKVDSIMNITLHGSHYLSGGEFGVEGSIISLLILGIAIVCFSRFYPSSGPRKGRLEKMLRL